MALGKNTTIKTIISMVRIKTGTVIDDKITDALFIDLLNMNVADLAKRLNEINAPFYMSSGTITLSGASYPISSLAIDRLIKLVDGTLGLVLPVSTSEYEKISLNTSQNGSSMYYVHEGEVIRIFKGASLAAHGTLTLHYYRVPTYATLTSEYPDIPDSFTALLVKTLCSDIYSYKRDGQRDADKEKQIADEIAGFKQAYGA